MGKLRRKFLELTLLSGVGGALSATPAPAEAREFEPATLRWVRADNAGFCPSEWEVAQAVTARLGPGALVSPARATLVVEASIQALPDGGFHVDIALVSGDTIVGRRELSSPETNCSSIAEQAALVIALTIDPEASLLGTAQAPAPPAQEPSPAVPVVLVEPAPRNDDTEPRATAAPARAWEGDLELAAGLATGIVPDIAAGFSVRGRARPPLLPVAIELEGGYFPPSEVELEPGQGADFALLYLGAALCSKPRREAPLRLSVCGGPELAAVTGQGYGFDQTPRFWSFNLALSARARLGFRLTRGFSVVIGPNLVLPFGRDRFVAVTNEGTEELFRMKPAGFGFELGGVWEL